MKGSYNIKKTSFVCVALLSAALPGVAKKKQVRPNVVFIYADDLGRGMVVSLWTKDYIYSSY